MLMLSLTAVCSVPTKPDKGIIVSDEPYFIESNATFACEDGFGVNRQLLARLIRLGVVAHQLATVSFQGFSF